MDIKALAKEYESYIIERRRYYHSHPELPEQEKETRAQIHKDLEAIGITDIRDMKDCYGLVATIHGGKPGKTIALRSDIDALPIQEETGLPFASVTPGVMHACAHDTHIAMLLGAARILNTVKDELCGDVRLVVQPSEELANGAPKMMKEGALEGVDAIYGAHTVGSLEAPLIDVTSGNRMACCHGFQIEVEGVSAHGSAPHLGIDAITAACAIVEALQQVVSRQNDPLNPLVLTVGTIDGGTRFNVIPNRVQMTGTVRTFSLGTEVEGRMRKIIETVAEALGCKASLSYQYMTPPLINRWEDLAQIARGAVVKLFGEESIGHNPTQMGSEDFAWYGDEVPYFFALIGSRDEAKGYTHSNHQEQYDIGEEILQRGSAVMAQFAADFLAQDA